MESRAVSEPEKKAEKAKPLVPRRLCFEVHERLGADGTVLRATALNDYAVDIPVEDCERYPVILALTRDGAPLSRRDMGPIWIVYPRDDFPELQVETVNARWVWQLTELEVR